jgi:hypothetical protein
VGGCLDLEIAPVLVLVEVAAGGTLDVVRARVVPFDQVAV